MPKGAVKSYVVTVKADGDLMQIEKPETILPYRAESIRESHILSARWREIDDGQRAT